MRGRSVTGVKNSSRELFSITAVSPLLGSLWGYSLNRYRRVFHLTRAKGRGGALFSPKRFSVMDPLLLKNKQSYTIPNRSSQKKGVAIPKGSTEVTNTQHRWIRCRYAHIHVFRSISNPWDCVLQHFRPSFLSPSSPSFSLPLLLIVVTQIRGHTACSFLPRPHYGSCLHFYREIFFSQLFPRRLAPNVAYARYVLSPVDPCFS